MSNVQYNDTAVLQPKVAMMALARTTKYLEGGEFPSSAKSSRLMRSRAARYQHGRGGKWVVAHSAPGRPHQSEIIDIDDLYEHSFSLTPRHRLPDRAKEQIQVTVPFWRLFLEALTRNACH